jgi:tetratricopeptide (TPR) repeat protein
MSINTAGIIASLLLVCAIGTARAAPAGTAFDSELLSLQRNWAHANYETADKKARRAAFEAVVEEAHMLSARYPDEVAAVAWDGIVLSTYAGEVSAFSAMKVANQALAQLQRAEAMNGDALGGGIYASLGALYSKVPGGFVGFGDDDVARAYLERALAIDPTGIDNNYFYGEFLIEQGEYRAALDALDAALASAVNPDRPVFDAGRRAEIRELIQIASNQVARAD